ncbi:MAG: porin family protein [Xanthobacteraceae bacterium]|nr:porin family protein [Xanthobacteraceae bacterium]
MLKRIALAAVAAVGISAAAQAADVPVKGPVYKAAPATYNWSGFYIGGTVGYGWGQTDWTAAPGGAFVDINTDGVIGGLTLGRNWQAAGSRWVFGIEADISAADIKGTGFLPCSVAGCTTTVRWLSTVRGRVGFSQGTWLFYGTGGVAFGGVNYFAPVGVNVTQTEVGWTAGLGIEAMLRRNWSWKVEYLFVDLGQSDPFSGTVFTNAHDIHIARLGLNYRW